MVAPKVDSIVRRVNFDGFSLLCNTSVDTSTGTPKSHFFDQRNCNGDKHTLFDNLSKAREASVMFLFSTVSTRRYALCSFQVTKKSFKFATVFTCTLFIHLRGEIPNPCTHFMRLRGELYRISDSGDYWHNTFAFDIRMISDLLCR